MYAMMQVIPPFILACVLLTGRIHGICTETETSLNAHFDCDSTTKDSDHFIPLYSNTTIAQKLDLCAISESQQFESFRIQLAGAAIQQRTIPQIAAIIADFTYSFYVYDYNQWTSANCDDNLYNIDTECSVSPILSYIDTSLALSGFGAYNAPYLVLNFDTPFEIDSSYADTSLIWILTVNTGFEPNENAIINFLACNLNSDNSIEYTVYPLKYNDDTAHNTAVMYNLSPLCATQNDNRLQSLNPYASCDYDPSIERRDSSWDQQVTGLRYMQTDERYFQYFAVAQSTALAGVALYFEKPPTGGGGSGGKGGGDSSSNCAFTAVLTLYDASDELVTRSERTVNGLSTAGSSFAFFLDETISIEVGNDEIQYFYFGVSIADGISSDCGIASMMCFDQSNMATFFYAGDNSVECIDYYEDPGRSSTMLNKLDFAFDLLTTTQDPTEAPVASTSSAGQTTANPAQSPVVDTTLVYYTTIMVDPDEKSTHSSDDEPQKQRQSVIEFEETIALWVAIAILAGVGLLLLIGALIVAQFTKSDNFIYGAVVVFVVHSVDVFSDVLFCISIWTDHALVPGMEHSGTFLLLAICSLIFIIAPMFKNFYDLIQFQRETQDDPLHGDRYRAWLNSFGTTLLIFALISGSTFGTMKLMNSNLLGLRMFSMGLCVSLLRDYHSYRMVNVVLMENLPQLIIQIAFTSVLTEAVPPISILAAITSILSIIVAVVDHFSKKELSKQEVPSELFTFQITANEISAKPSKYRNRQKKVIKGISKILVLDPTAIEILTIDEYSDEMGDGLIVHFLITTIKYKAYEMHQKLKDSIVNGSLARNMSKAWELQPRDPPSITHLRLLQIESVDDAQDENIEGGGNTNETTTGTGAGATPNGGSASQQQLLKKNKVTAALPQIMKNISASSQNNKVASSPRSNAKKKIVVKASDSMQFQDSKLVQQLRGNNGDGSGSDDDDDVVVVPHIPPIQEAAEDIDANANDNKEVIDTKDDGEAIQIEMQDVKS